MGFLWFLCRRLLVVSALLIVGMSWQGTVEAASLRLTWTDTSNNEDGFKIERMDANGSFVQVGTVGANAQSYTDSGLTSGVTYCYVVRAFNSVGSSDPSNGTCATARDSSSTSNISSNTTTSSTTSSASGTASAAASLRLSWRDVSSNENGFKIERMGPNGMFVQIATVGANVQTHTDSGLTAGVTYCYVVRAFNSAGPSDPSNGACATARDASSISNISSNTTTTSTSGNGSGTTLTLQSSNSTSSTSSTTSSTGSSTAPSVSNNIGGKWKDYKVSLRMKSMDNDSIGIMFRYQDQNNYYRFSWNRDLRFRRLERIQNGVTTVLAQDSVRYEMRRTYQVEIVAQGSTLRVLIDGTQVFSVTDSSSLQGTIALYSDRNEGSIFDDIVVEDLSTGAVLLSEDFNDGNFNGWTIIDDKGTTGGPSVWSAQSGALVQSSNIRSNTPAKPGTFALYTKGSWTDYRVMMKIKSLDNDAIGVMFRYQDPNNYYRFSWSAEGNWVRVLEKIENGMVTELAADRTPYIVGQIYELQIVADNPTLQVLVDGNSVFSVADSSLTRGMIALYSAYNQGSVFDDVLVEDLATGAVLLRDNFNDNFMGWTIIDEGMNGGPSVWSVSNGALVQSSNIRGWSDAIGPLGTFVLY